MSVKVLKRLKGFKQLLNLREIVILPQQGCSSTATDHPVAFFFYCGTKHGIVEDPDLSNLTIEVVESRLTRKGEIVLKLREVKDGG